ncbi:MAG: YceI family protein [Gammaproteobacteria bacterium]|nr:YceI family protein [Gammaproteobacteria bacterium]
MKNTAFGKLFLISGIILSSPVCHANVQKWQIVPDKSSITFTATQNNAPVTGEFKAFSGDINFDVEQLSNSNVTIIIDIASVKTSYADIAKTLMSQEWFDAKTFPKATFKANSFSKMGENNFQANGTLTIRDKSTSATLKFELQPVSKTTSIAKGETTIQRSTFGIGRGEWASTDNVKDEVKINFTLAATKQ